MNKKKKTISGNLADKLFLMKIGDDFDKKSYIIEIYGDYNFFISRSFDVHFARAKELMPETMKFRSIKKRITRIK